MIKQQLYIANYPIRLLDFDIQIDHLFFIPNKEDTKNHIHYNYELHYITEGSVLFRLSFDETVEVHSGEWLLIGSNVYHEEFVQTPYCSGYSFDFDIPKETNGSPICVLQNMPYFKSEQDPWVGECLHKIMKESEEQKLGSEDSCKNMFALMLIQIFRSCIAEKTVTKPHSKKNRDIYLVIDSYFNRVFDYDGRNLCIEELAEELHASTRHVNRLLQAKYGVTFREKLLDTRMKFVAYLLKSTDQTIAEIANLCGYTVTYLIRSFKKAYGTTPAQYRKLYRTDMM